MPMFDDVKILERPPEEKRAQKKKGLHFKKKKIQKMLSLRFFV